ncbi:hypothetical protein MMC29_000098 [Sticta canariensis]|nr:hypothetical protein [Sticta canariensis]
MPEEVPFQIVTRAARRRALGEGPAQASSANAPTTNDSSNNAPQRTPRRRTAPSSTISRTRRRTPPGVRRRGTNAGVVNSPPMIVPDPPAPPAWENLEDEALIAEGSGAGDFMEWIRANFPRTAPDGGEVSSGLMLPPTRCTSPSCPVPSTIPHYQGLYLHDGEPSRGLQFLLGPSNPPPDVWRMFTRLYVRIERPGDREALSAFLRNHYVQPD